MILCQLLKGQFHKNNLFDDLLAFIKEAGELLPENLLYLIREELKI